MSLNRARHRRAADEAKRRRASAGRFLKLKDDTNKIRFFGFTHVVNDYDVHLGRYTKADLKEGVGVGTTSTETFCEFRTHFVNRTKVICTDDETCPVCEEVKQIVAEEGGKSERAASLRVSRRYAFNAVDTEEAGPKMRVLEVPSTVWEEVLEYLNDPEFEEDELLGCEGRDFIIKRDPDAPPSKMYTVRLRDPKRCKALPKALLADVADLYLMPDFLPGYGLAEFEVPDEIKSAMKTAGKKVSHAEKGKRRVADDAEEGADEEAALAVGARVSVDFDSGTCEGVIKAVDEEGATIVFDDGDEQDVPLDEITLLEGAGAGNEEPDDEEDVGDEASEEDAEAASEDVEAKADEASGVDEADEASDDDEALGAETKAPGAADQFVKGKWVTFMLDGKPAYGQITGDPDVNGVFEVTITDGREFEMDASEADLIKEGDVPEAGPKRKTPLKKRVLKKKAAKKK